MVQTLTLFQKCIRQIHVSAKDLEIEGDLTSFYYRSLSDLMGLTGSRYGAFSLNDGIGGIHEFIALGMSCKQLRALEGEPEGKGVLGAIYGSDKVVRVDNISKHPESCGFPEGHPMMKNLMGTGLKVNGELIGALYLTDKMDGTHFNEVDEDIMSLFVIELQHVISQNRLLTDLLGVNSKLNKSNEQLKYLIENNPAVIYSSSPNNKFDLIYISDNIEEMLGYEPNEILEQKDFWFNQIHPEDRSNILNREERVHSKYRKTSEYRIKHKEGDYRWIHDVRKENYDKDGRCEGIIGSLMDITERKNIENKLIKSSQELKETQQQLIQTEKLASIGQLAAGVAHEINNPVGYISSNMNTMQQYVNDLLEVIQMYQNIESDMQNGVSPKLEQLQELKKKMDLEFTKKDMKDLLQESFEGVERVKQIVKDLKDFSRTDDAVWQWANIHDGLNSTFNIVYNELKYKAEVIKEYNDLPEIQCVPSQINQVFLNLLVNAAHAIDEHGMITIRTSRKNDSEIMISIEDTGRGITPDVINKIFDPFYTTKPIGKGTGLGLSISYGIVKKHHGEISVESEVGMGTIFYLVLPIKQPNLDDVCEKN